MGERHSTPTRPKTWQCIQEPSYDNRKEESSIWMNLEFQYKNVHAGERKRNRERPEHQIHVPLNVTAKCTGGNIQLFAQFVKHKK